MRAHSGTHGRDVRRLGWHAVLLASVTVMVFPLLWALLASFKPANEIYGAALLPSSASLENYRVALLDFPIGHVLVNTLVMASGVTLLQLLVAVPAAHAFARFRLRHERMATALVTGALLMPPQAVIVPQFLMVSELGWRDTYWGLIIPQVSGCALAVILLREHVRAIPASLFEAATVEGASEWSMLRFVTLPLLRPALGAVAILVFIGTWNEYLWPMIVAPRPEQTTIQMGLQLFLNQEGANPGPLIAAAMLTTLPIVAVYLVASRRVIHAFLQSGLH
ncbi:carbohydrate ABC transporter permease [Nonomuraea sp. NPDC046802]|uniref:carbohydrate ABC transporter permease n=1 Tax=Nonomuraea sp. NPDC046802 TaxID=3154919 RepID=UPI0033C9F12A